MDITDDGYVEILEDSGDTRCDLKLPNKYKRDELLEQMDENGHMAIVLEAVGQEC